MLGISLNVLDSEIRRARVNTWRFLCRIKGTEAKLLVSRQRFVDLALITECLGDVVQCRYLYCCGYPVSVAALSGRIGASPLAELNGSSLTKRVVSCFACLFFSFLFVG